jgi:hypothetical protein
MQNVSFNTMTGNNTWELFGITQDRAIQLKEAVAKFLLENEIPLEKGQPGIEVDLRPVFESIQETDIALNEQLFLTFELGAFIASEHPLNSNK